MTRLLLALPLMILLAPFPAWAHKMKLFAVLEGDSVVGRAYFAGGGKAAHLEVLIKDAAGAVLATVRTDADGQFRQTVPTGQALTLSVDSGDGHAASVSVAAGASSPAPLPAAPALAPPAAALEMLVERAVARQVTPLREQLDAYEEKIRLHDILGGVGTIFGLFGLLAWAAARRVKRR